MQLTNLTFLAQKSSKSGKVVEEQHYVVFLWILYMPLCLFDLTQCDCLRLRDHMLAICIAPNFCSRNFGNFKFHNYMIIMKAIITKFCINETIKGL